MTTLPHLLTITPDGPPTLACPHPPALGSPCASLVPCGCPADTGTALCPDSPTAAHQWVDGEWCRPAPECWAVTWGDLDDAIDGYGLPAGTYRVWPTQGAEEAGYYPLRLLFTEPKVGAA